MSRLSSKLGFAVFLMAICLTAACGNGKSGTVELSVELMQPIGTGSFSSNPLAQQPGRFSALVSGGTAPYELDWQFGGCADNQAAEVTEAGIVEADVIFYNLDAPATFTATVTVVDAIGNSDVDSVTFTVMVGTDLCWPSIDSARYEDGIISVHGSDPSGNSLYFVAELASGNVTVEGPFNETAVSAEFHVKVNDILEGGNFVVSVTASCVELPGWGTDTTDVFGSFDAFPLADDTLYAIATQTQAAVGEPVRIVVATGDTASSFQYLNSCILTWQVGGSYVGQSFDIGAPDDVPEQAVPIDGVWGDMGATSFLLNLFPIETMPIGNGLLGTGFYVTPLGGSDITANGLLFNFQMEFAEPGTYTIGILDNPESVVSRTYYQDSTAAEDYFWSDISNNHAYNTIVVE
ncbi:MAG: hypothetical protein H7A35_10570 [Planctomycetales bacterium]|nr:hypothetical protein [bacterium]UNM07312.1 MAG: hypothetical protein H7A35_10570 [Planctomycetales bacterium]